MELWNQNGLSSAVTFVQHCQIIAVSLWLRPEFETPRLFMRVRESVSVSDRRNINFDAKICCHKHQALNFILIMQNISFICKQLIIKISFL